LKRPSGSFAVCSKIQEDRNYFKMEFIIKREEDCTDLENPSVAM
jgi:hypothetical protein